MTAQDDYKRAATVNLPDDVHETRKVRAIRLPRNEKFIYAAMVVFVIVNVIMIAIENGWLR